MQGDGGYGYYPYGSEPGWPPEGGGYYGQPSGQPYGQAGRPKRRGGVLTHLLVALLAAGLAAGLTVALDHPASTPAASSGTTLPGGNAVPNPAAAPANGSTGSEQQVVNKVEPGLVIIQTAMQYQSDEGFATGMVINPDGLVLTNNHVIEDSTKITAKVVATGKTYTARVLGYDTTGDVALIQLEGASGLRTVPIGNSSTVKVGAPVVALGNAEGQGTIIPAGGAITGLDKSIDASDQGGTIQQENLHGMIETNAGIVSGDSGGPLVSSSGQVIAMDTAGSSGSGLSQQQTTTAGFAIPIDTALSVARQIAAGHASSTVSIGYPSFIGILIAPGDDTATSPQQQAQQQQAQEGGFGGFFGGSPSCYTANSQVVVPSSIAPANTGTLVDGVICNSPAASAGLTGGSVITAVDGRPTSSPGQLQSVLSSLRPGDTVSVNWVSTSGQSSTSRLTLVDGPPA